jgi:small GTP-binding protein
MFRVRCFRLVEPMEPLYDPTSGELLLRVAMCGGHFVGQSQLLQRFAGRHYDDDSDTTIGANVRTRDAEINGESCRLEYFDIGGKERFRTIALIFLRKAMGVIVTFSVKDERSFEAARERYAIAMAHVI